MDRAKEFQRGTARVLESNKKRRKVLFDETDILLGAGDHAFEPRYSDQKPLEIHDLKGLFLFLWRCFILFAFIKKPDREKARSRC